MKYPGRQIYWTENHIILNHTNEYQAGQLFPEEVFRARQKNGKDICRDIGPKILDWIRVKGLTGFCEWDSNCYMEENIHALLNIYDFAKDQKLKKKTKGVSKEHRPNPIVQMGLFTDNNAIPITYQLFSGNTNDCLTYRPNFSRIKKEYNLGRVVVVADKGMSTGDNIWYTLSAKDGYVFSLSVRGANKEMKDYVLKEEGYEWLGNEYKRKSRLYPRTIWVTSNSGKKMKKVVHEKQVIFYSEKYDKRAKAERAAAITKAQDLISNPGKYSRNTSYGAAGYIKGIDFDKDTGEILTPSKSLSIDWDKIKEEEALDGYYAIVTSEHKEKEDRIIEMYRGLWKIEEAFRVTKSDLEARQYTYRGEIIFRHTFSLVLWLLLLPGFSK